MSGTFTGLRPAEIDIHPGEHPEWHLAGWTFNADTIWTTFIAAGLVLVLGFMARHYLTKNPDDHVPSKLQLLWETIVGEVNTQVEDNLGRVQPFVTPLAISLFFFILIANWLELIPTELNPHVHLLPAPTADTNLTYAMALLVFVSTFVYGIRQRGAGPYFKGFISEPVAKNPVINLLARGFFTGLTILEELLKPVTLALRLFGNIFAGGIMLSLIAALITWQVGHIPVGGVLGVVFNIIWKLFDAVIGAIQAFIFALLTVLYFAMAGSGHGSGDHDEDDAHDDQPAAEPASQTAA